MSRYALLALMALFLDGCVGGISGPQDNQDFYRVSKLADLAGVYKNEGDDGSVNPNFHRYLSEEIWGYKSNILLGVTGPNLPAGIRNRDIEFIEVTSTDNSLTAKAIKNGCVVYEKTYFSGKDFELKNGQIVIRKKTDLLSRGGEDIKFGPSYEEVTLGIDTGKQGKVRHTLNEAVLVYMFLPLVGTENSDVRFERVSDKPQGFKTCENR
jgi:hypothetical protein